MLLGEPGGEKSISLCPGASVVHWLARIVLFLGKLMLTRRRRLNHSHSTKVRSGILREGPVRGRFRSMGLLRLHIQDIDLARNKILVRDGEVAKEPRGLRSRRLD
jgi:hypothetical protein